MLMDSKSELIDEEWCILHRLACSTPEGLNYNALYESWKSIITQLPGISRPVSGKEAFDQHVQVLKECGCVKKEGRFETFKLTESGWRKLRQLPSKFQKEYAEISGSNFQCVLRGNEIRSTELPEVNTSDGYMMIKVPVGSMPSGKRVLIASWS